jgi:hypothetical protein
MTYRGTLAVVSWLIAARQAGMRCQIARLVVSLAYQTFKQAWGSDGDI